MHSNLTHTPKSNGKGSLNSFLLESELFIHVIQTERGTACEVSRSVSKGTIQLAMCSKGEMMFWFGPAYSMPLSEGQVMTLYNPAMELPHRIDITDASELVILSISVSQLHKLFIKESEELHFLRGEKALEKFYAKDVMHPMLNICIKQIIESDLSDQSKKLYMRGKAYEILSYYFNKKEGADLYESCPFLRDQGNVKKVRSAKDIILERMADPPTIKALAGEVEMSEYQLKLGFKNIYGNTIYGYLNDFKMNRARKMLDSGEYKVQDAAFELGYTNPSHFIAAFKKKFGITPKKYLMQ